MFLFFFQTMGDRREEDTEIFENHPSEQVGPKIMYKCCISSIDAWILNWSMEIIIFGLLLSSPLMFHIELTNILPSQSSGQIFYYYQ